MNRLLKYIAMTLLVAVFVSCNSNGNKEKLRRWALELNAHSPEDLLGVKYTDENELLFLYVLNIEDQGISGRQLEAARVAVTRYMNREGQIWLRIFPDKPITKKPLDVRMGKGKGNPEGFVATVTPGRIIIEVDGVPYDIAKEALRLAAQKLPVATKFIVRRDYDLSQNA